MTLLEERPANTLAERPALVLATARLRLRLPHPGDAEALVALLNDRRIAENTARLPHPYRLADAEQFIAHARSGSADRELSLAVTLRDGTLIGGCGIGRLRRDGPEIGYWIGIPHWNRGYAGEAARVVIDHAFEEGGHDFLLGGARVTNPASRRVLEKCGYQWTGVVLQRVRALGTSVPCDRFRLTRDRWELTKDFGKIDRAL